MRWRKSFYFLALEKYYFSIFYNPGNEPVEILDWLEQLGSHDFSH